MCADPDAFQWASDRDGVRKDAQALLRRQAAVCPDLAVAGASAAPVAALLGVRAKCRAEARDYRLAKGRDFRKAAAARSAAAVHWGARARRDAQERLPAQLPQVSLQKVVYSGEPRRLAEPVRHRAAQQERPGEWVLAPQEQWALPQQAGLQAPGLAAWEQSSGPQEQQLEARPGELLALLVWSREQQASPELASPRQAPRELAAEPLQVQPASTAPPLLRLPSVPSRLWRLPPPGPRLPQLPEFFSEPFPQHRRESNSNASFFL